MIRAIPDSEADTAIAHYIGPHPANPGLDEYWLVRPGIAVWAIIGTLAANDGDVDAVIRLHHLTRDELDAALAFYARHRALIDNRLAQNDVP